ncbi:hypothetical protein [Oceanidesulfovibrio marinus]|uniref:hypothetical protein n=1 Tax=Oceanidesulfovibrio marinus TaxID=370038 RepID=UPI00118668DF|nr:hypothetical protein [Oceanidesulfovibrio marinus]
MISSAGRGNHCLTAIIPVSVVGEAVGAPQRLIAESVAFIHLVTGYVKTEAAPQLRVLCG